MNNLFSSDLINRNTLKICIRICTFSFYAILKDYGNEAVNVNVSSTMWVNLTEEGALDNKQIFCPSPLDGPIDWGLVGKGIALSMGQGISKIYPKIYFQNYLILKDI